MRVKADCILHLRGFDQEFSHANTVVGGPSFHVHAEVVFYCMAPGLFGTIIAMSCGLVQELGGSCLGGDAAAQVLDEPLPSVGGDGRADRVAGILQVPEPVHP